MKKSVKGVAIVLSLVLAVASLAGCGDSKKTEGKVSADSGKQTSAKDESGVKKFPKFKEKDVEGNTIDDSVFSKYSATLVTLWFTGCKTCVDEMPDVEKFSKELKAKNVNVLGGVTDVGSDKEALKTAKKILEKKGVTYQNINIPFDKDGAISEFIRGISAYPTAFIVNSKGEIVGEPIEGAINSPERMKEINKRIDDIINNK